MAIRRTLLPSVLILLSWITGNVDSTRMRTLPKEFYFGVSTASYQVEGAWNATGKGESIWDHLVHTLPSSVKDKTNADQACDSYRLYETDVVMLDRLGVDFYRFSISWSRLLPTGFMDQVSQDGVDFYNRLIDSLIERDIVPMVVLHHWDLPQPLQVLGGWPNVLLAEYFADFARTAFSLFGDRVRLWATFSQPDLMCRRGYGGRELAPMLNASGLAEYMCAHTVLLAHAKAYHIYNKEYRKKNGGMIGIILHSYWSEPASKSYEDQRAAEQSFMFNFAWMAEPIFSSRGNYPKAMSKRIAARSSRQKFQRSRFPSLQPSEVRFLAGSADFLGLSHSTTRMVRAAPTSFVVPENPSFEDDRGVDEFEFDRSRAPAAKWLKVSSKGFRKVLNFIRKEYRDPEVIVMGDGLESAGGLHDQERVAHMNLYLSTIADAIEDGCNIKAYSAWSLMDGFNWLDGYTKKYGLYEVDFRSPNRTRTLRDSGKAYADIIKARSFVSSDICSDCDEDGEDLFDEYNSVENN